MARRRNQSVIEDLFEIAAKLAWWVGVLLALVAYLCFNHYAGLPVPVPTTPADMGVSSGSSASAPSRCFSNTSCPSRCCSVRVLRSSTLSADAS